MKPHPQPSQRRSLTRVFAMPLLIALLSGAGLLSALLGNGPWDWVSWVTLAVPVVITVHCYRVARRF
ncbi:MAG: hypothetical protein R3296_05040 [Oleiphilaceae bacterium]|nr:hypothetical protein [Oleiphilaceae bacterium]